MSEQLKACPMYSVKKDFEHRLYYGVESGRIQCNCGASGPVMAFTESSAIKAWNTRPIEDKLTAIIQAQGEMLEFLWSMGGIADRLNEGYFSVVFQNKLETLRARIKELKDE